MRKFFKTWHLSYDFVDYCAWTQLDASACLRGRARRRPHTRAPTPRHLPAATAVVTYMDGAEKLGVESESGTTRCKTHLSGAVLTHTDAGASRIPTLARPVVPDGVPGVVLSFYNHTEVVNSNPFLALLPRKVRFEQTVSGFVSWTGQIRAAVVPS